MTVKNTRANVIQIVEGARGKSATAAAKAEDARSSSTFSDEGREEIASAWGAGARKAVSSALDRARTHAGEARRKAEGKLAASRAVDFDERAAAEATLLTVRTAAASDPTVLVRAYEKRAPGSLADRMVLEETIQTTLDAGLGDVAFVEEWNRVRSALEGAVRTEEELEALEDLAAVDQLETYIAAAETTLEGDLAEIETGAGASFTIPVETARHTVATYEKGGPVETETVRSAEEVRSGGTPAADLEPQHVPAAVAAETEARRAELAGITE